MINATGNRMTSEIRRQADLARAVAQTQTQISTSKRIARASDDPVASARLATLRQTKSNGAAYAVNISLAATLTAQADTALRGSADLMNRAQQLIIAGANGSASASDRASIAIELRSIADELDTYQATKSPNGEALFSAGTAMSMRLSDDVVMAPVSSRAKLFEVSGVNISTIVRDASTAFDANNNAGIQTALTDIASGVSQIADSASRMGLKAAKIDRLKEAQANLAIEYEVERSSLEDTDLTEAIARLNSQTITLEAAQAAFARINRRTLFDILS